MAHLVRVTRTHYEKGGRRVPKGTRGAKKVTEKSAMWYGQGIPGMPPSKRVPLARDREAAKRMLADMVRAAERGEAKMLDRGATDRPLAEHLTDFESDLALGLRLGTGRRRRTAPSANQVTLVVQRVRDLIAGCGFRFPADLKGGAAADKLSRYLRGRVGKTRAEGGISAQTATFILAEARRFARWIAGKGTGVPAGAFDAVAGFDPANERTHARRDISPGELGKLLEAARTSARGYRGLTGPDRHHLYLTAFATGFRASELAALTPAHFDLSADPPSVVLPGKLTKNKKAVCQPIPPAVAVSLRAFLAGKPADKPVWPGEWAKQKGGAKMLRIDLAAAGVAYCVDGPQGKQYADFHALRHTFCSALAASGAGVKELQTLARHSTPQLTLGIYTHTRSAELVKAVGRLVVPGQAGSPLAHLTREDLEGLVFGMSIILGTVLGPPPGDPGLRAPLRAPRAEIPGDSGGRLDTIGPKEVRAS